MAVQPFASVDTGFTVLLGKKDFTTANIAVILVTTDATGGLNRDAVTYADIRGAANANVSATLPIATPLVTATLNKVQFTHSKALFTADQSLSGRYVAYLFGNSASLVDTATVFGYVDLTATLNAESVNAEFSFTPHADRGLFEVGRTTGV